MNKEIRLIIVTLIILIVLVMGIATFYSKKGIVNLSCTIDSGVDSCPTGDICYFSQSCPKGGDCLSPEGDSICHKTCVSDSDCPSVMPVCRDVELFRGDIVTSKRFCVA